MIWWWYQMDRCTSNVCRQTQTQTQTETTALLSPTPPPSPPEDVPSRETQITTSAEHVGSRNQIYRIAKSSLWSFVWSFAANLIKATRVSGHINDWFVVLTNRREVSFLAADKGQYGLKCLRGPLSEILIFPVPRGSSAVTNQFGYISQSLREEREQRNWAGKGQRNKSEPCAFHSLKPDLSGSSRACGGTMESTFPIRTTIKCCGSADVSLLPNEALDNQARIKRPLWSSHSRLYLWLPHV